jgi:hypothetical protein
VPKEKVAVIILYTEAIEGALYMRLSDVEKKFVKETCEFYKDSRVAEELTRIRYSTGVNEKVTIDQVRKYRYSEGIYKERGRGVVRIRRKKKDV